MFFHSFPLQSDHNFFKINSKIKGKCSLNAGFLKRKLRRIPSIKIDGCIFTFVITERPIRCKNQITGSGFKMVTRVQKVELICLATSTLGNV